MSDEKLLYGGATFVPVKVATCPECGFGLFVSSEEWDSDTGVPTRGGLYVECADPDSVRHNYHQSEWQNVINKVAKWAGIEDAAPRGEGEDRA